MPEALVPQSLLTAREAAQVLAISERKLWSLAKCHRIPVVRIDRSVRYAMDDLEKFIREHKSEQEGSRSK